MMITERNSTAPPDKMPTAMSVSSPMHRTVQALQYADSHDLLSYQCYWAGWTGPLRKETGLNSIVLSAVHAFCTYSLKYRLSGEPAVCLWSVEKAEHEYVPESLLAALLTTSWAVKKQQEGQPLLRSGWYLAGGPRDTKSLIESLDHRTA